jgi:2-succinyl-5-enolpyruvyl-6-hydroxy-3-cyclohexene-1-carboxylate synthase
MTQPNPSTAQARVMVDELHRQGVDFAVISPGSRSSALAIAFDQHPGIDTSVVLDERSAGFQALGRARATGLPAVAVCTSGTAVANLLPAVVEADLSLVPLLVVSADRPPELLHVGANQTIDQGGMFGARARWSCDIAAAEPGQDANGYWRTTVAQAVARALGHGSRPGPVHLNVAFREPTVPVGDDGRSSAPPYGHGVEGRPSGEPWQRHLRTRSLAAVLPFADGRRGLVVAGEGDFEPAALERVATRLHWPLLGTAASGLRRRNVVTSYHHLLVAGVPDRLRPELVVSIGRIGPSDRLGALTALEVPQVCIDPWGAWNDPRRHATHLIQADPVPSLAALAPAVDTDLTNAWTAADAAMRSALDERIMAEPIPSGPGVARSLGEVSVDHLVVASSMPIRDVDAHTAHTGRVIANRGASGIDGFISTALGVASSPGRTLALAGDLSFLHDAGGLISDPPRDFVLVVVDNGGGGLFDLLPQAQHAPHYERLFVTPHGLDLPRLAEGYGLTATSADLASLAPTVNGLIDDGGRHAVVVPVDREAELKLRRALDEVARDVCADLS